MKLLKVSLKTSVKVDTALWLLQLQQELINIERNMTLMEAIMKETKELQELTRYPCQIYIACYWLADHWFNIQKTEEKKENEGSCNQFQLDGLLKIPEFRLFLHSL